jgi:hypothetical protein
VRVYQFRHIRLKARRYRSCAVERSGQAHVLASSLRASAAMSAAVLAWPLMPQPPSGDSVISTRVRSAGCGAPAARLLLSAIEGVLLLDRTAHDTSHLHA